MRSRSVAILLSVLLLTMVAAGLIGCRGSGGARTELPAAGATLPDSRATAPILEDMSLGQAIARIKAAQAPADVDAALWEELTAELTRVLSARGISEIVQHPPQGEHNRVTDLQLVKQAEGGWRMEWSYVNVGDLNIDGLVSVNDLTPIGQHYNAREGDPDWGSAKAADGNGDGMVTISDITPIGQNYLAMVQGYRVYGSDTADASEAEWQASWQAWVDAYVPGPRAFYPEVAFSELVAGQSPGFSCMLYLLDYECYKVAPYDSDGSAGQGSYANNWAAGGGPWHMFGHDRRHTRRSPYVGAQTNSVKWSYSVGEPIFSSPAIGVDGTVYIGTREYKDPNEPIELTYKLDAINPDGSLKWEYTTGGNMYSSPAIDAHGTVYVGSYDDSTLYAIKPDGSLKWSYDLVGYVESSPAVGVDGTVYLGSGSTLCAIKPDGTLKWSYTTAPGVDSSPAIGLDGTVYVGAVDKLYAFNPDGSLKWSYTTGEWVASSPAIGADGTVYVGSGDHNLYAINPDGSLKWTYTTGGTVESSPAIGADGTVYVGSRDNALHAVNADGSLKWSYATGGFVSSSPAIGADGTVYVRSSDSNLYAFNPDGTLMWLYTTAYGGGCSSPAIGADGTVYVGGGKLYAFGP